MNCDEVRDALRQEVGEGVNGAIAKCVEDVAACEPQMYKKRAFLRAAKKIRSLDRELKSDEDFKEIEFIGPATARIIQQYFDDHPN